MLKEHYDKSQTTKQVAQSMANSSVGYCATSVGELNPVKSVITCGMAGASQMVADAATETGKETMERLVQVESTIESAISERAQQGVPQGNFAEYRSKT